MFKFPFNFLQLFGGEGGGAGGAAAGGTSAGTAPGGEAAGSPTVVTGDDDGRQALRDLGVPESKIRKNRTYKVPKPAGAVATAGNQAQGQQAVAANADGAQQHEVDYDAEWDKLMQVPEYKKKVQDIVQARLGKGKAAQETLEAVGPMLNAMALQQGQDPEKADYKQLNDKYMEHSPYIEDVALQEGISYEEAARKVNDKYQRMTMQRTFASHMAGLEAQVKELQQEYPGMDLRTELKNPYFAAMTKPGQPFSVKQAYEFAHRDELQAQRVERERQIMQSQIASGIRSNAQRPVEAGTSTQTAPVQPFNPATATKEQREILKRNIHLAAAQGRTIMPGHEFD